MVAVAYGCALVGSQGAQAQDEVMGCSRDVDCKGERICEAGACVYPSEPMSMAPAPVPPVMSAEPPAQPLVPAVEQTQPAALVVAPAAASAPGTPPSDEVEDDETKRPLLSPHDFAVRLGYSAAPGEISSGVLSMGAMGGFGKRFGESRHLIQAVAGLDAYLSGGGAQLIYGAAYREDEKGRGRGFTRITVAGATAFGGGGSYTGLLLRGDLLFGTGAHAFMGLSTQTFVSGDYSVLSLSALFGL